MDYTTLVAEKTVDGSIRSWVNWGPVPATHVLTLAEDMIGSSLRVQQMRTLTTGTIAEGDTAITLPTDFREAISLRRTGDSAGVITLLDAEHFETRLVLDDDDEPFEGTPFEGTIDGLTSIRLNTTADEAYPYRLWYIASPPRLSEEAPTNYLTDRYSNILLPACLYWAYSFAKDAASRDHWYAMFVAALQEANSEADLGRQVETAAIHWGMG